MEITNKAKEWAIAEMQSGKVFALFGILFLIASISFWQVGKSELVLAFIYPTLIAGAVLFSAGVGFYFSNKTRISNFETDYKKNPKTFLESEIDRTERTMKSYQNIAFKVFPVIIFISFILAFLWNDPTWRASSISIMVFFLVVVMLDFKANKRVTVYHQQLKLALSELTT